MNFATRLPCKRILALAIIIAGLALWMPHQYRLSKIERSLAKSRAEQINLASQIVSMTQELAQCREALKLENATRDARRTALFSAERELANNNPDAYWAQAPSSWPDWNTNSPYVWLHKNYLPELRIQCFSEDGQIQPEVSQVLAIPKPQLEQLNSRLSQVVSEFRAAEMAKAKRIDESTGDVKKITVKIDAMPDEGAQLSSEFAAALQESLGPQRAACLVDASSDWLARQSSELGKQSMSVTVTRGAEGTTKVEVDFSGWIGHSMVSLPKGVPLVNAARIPQYLMPLFSEFE